MINIYCDGSIQGGLGGWAVGGWVKKSDNGEVLGQGVVSLGQHPTNTNNCAEYAAVKSALEKLIEHGETGDVLVHTDSKLVVCQLNKDWKCNYIHLRRYRDSIWALTKHFKSVTFKWIPREQNKDADAVSRSLYG